MYIEKIIEDDISLSVEDLTSGDVNGAIERKLKQKYEGKCWDNAYIVKVVKILKRNGIPISHTLTDGQGRTNAQFMVEAVELVPGDILVGCKIIEIEKHSVILCEHEYANVTIGDKFISPKKGQMLFVQVDQSSYLTNEDKISVRSSPFVIDDRKIVYIPSGGGGGITTDEKLMLTRALERLAAAHSRVDGCSKSLVKFFEDLLYPYEKGSVSTTPKALTPKGAVLTNIETLARNMIAGKKFSTGAFVSHPATNMTTVQAYQLPENWTSKLLEGAEAEKKALGEMRSYIIDKTTYDVVLKVLYEHSIYLNVIADMCKVYHDEKIRKSHDNIWESYRRVKLQQ